MDAFFAVGVITFLFMVGVMGMQTCEREAKIEEMKAEICQRESKTAGEFEKCLRVKE